MRRQITKHPNGAAANATPIPPSAARIIKSSIIIFRSLCVRGADRRDRVRGRFHVGKARGRCPFLSQTTPYTLVQRPRLRVFLGNRCDD